jgi:hypothetical protein
MCTTNILFINFSVTSSITSLYVADTSKYFMYIYYIGLKMNQTLGLCSASSSQSISLSIFPDRLYTRTVSWSKSWHDQLLNQAPCQGKLVNFLPVQGLNLFITLTYTSFTFAPKQFYLLTTHHGLQGGSESCQFLVKNISFKPDCICSAVLLRRVI